jgi:hypothetical protein
MRTGDGLFPPFIALLIPAAIFESFWQPDLTLALAILFAVLTAQAGRSKRPQLLLAGAGF